MAAPAKAGPKSIAPPIIGTCSDTLFRITRLSDGTVRIERKPRVQQSPGRDGRINTMHLSWPDLIEKEELHKWLIATVEANQTHRSRTRNRLTRKLRNQMTSNQKAILQLVQSKGGEITKQDAVARIGGQYYCNSDKHTGEVLSKMVNSGLLTRIKPGVFTYGKGKSGKPVVVPQAQASLF